MAKKAKTIKKTDIKKTELKDIGDLSVKIIDEYYLHLKDADCVRTVIYENKGSATIPINLRGTSFAFFSTCENFALNIDGEDKSDILKEDYSDYSKVVLIDLYAHLAPSRVIKIQITCKWKNFVSMIDDCYFSFIFTESASYRFILHGLNPAGRPFSFHINERKAEDNQDFIISRDSVVFEEIKVNQNNPLRIALLIPSTAKNLRTLSFFADEGKSFDGHIILLIQHLLSDFIHLANAISSGGATKSNIFIVGIPYSTKDKTVKYLRQENYPNLYITNIYPFDEQVRKAMQDAIGLSKSSGLPIVIIEDGGYAVPMLHKEMIGESSRFVGAVEQTTNGIWNDEELLYIHKIRLAIPIIDVARSAIKVRLESPLIGKAVCHNLQLLLGREFLEIGGRKIGVVGFGNTGSRIAKTLADLGAHVTVFSDDPIDLHFAEDEGYSVAESAKQIVSNCSLIVEATGREWASTDEIVSFRNGSYFASASSKRKGILYEEFNRLIDKDEIENVPGIGVRYKLPNDNRITLIADGYPVNFFDGESVPDKAIEFIPTILLESAKFLVKNKAKLPKGIIGFSPEKGDSKSIKELKQQLQQLQGSIAKRHRIINKSS
jgi:S-adenosylhomocysteine hydrolase